MKKEPKMKDVTYVETIETNEFIVEVYVSNRQRTSEEIYHSMERLIKAKYKGKKM